MQTTTSRNSSKNRRREERKRARGKKGSIYEEEYLVKSIGRLIDKVNSLRDDVKRVIDGLVRRRMWARAVAVEKVMRELVDLCQACLHEVFVSGLQQQPQQDDDDDDHRHLEDIRLPSALASLIAPPLPGIQPLDPSRSVPVVLPFEKLSLLGS